FAGMLYNKMRVEEPIGRQLCRVFNKYRDPSGVVRQHLVEEEQHAKVALAAADTSFKIADRAFEEERNAELGMRRAELDALRELQRIGSTGLKSLPDCPK